MIKPVTMTQIDAQRVIANDILDKERSARASNWQMEADACREMYERQLELVGKLLNQYHAQADAAAKAVMEIFR